MALSALGATVLVGYGLVVWDDFVMRRHLDRLRVDREYLRELIGVADDTPEGAALAAYLGEVNGRRALLELYLAEGPFRIFREVSLEEELRWTVRGVLGFDGQSSWFRIASPKFQFDLMREKGLAYAVHDNPSFDPALFRSVIERLRTLDGEEITLESHPTVRFTILRGDAAYERLQLAHPDGRRPGGNEHACLIERDLVVPMAELLKSLESADAHVRLRAAIDLYPRADEAGRLLTELVPTLQDENEDVRRVARRLLEAIGEPAIGHVIPLLDHPDPRTRLDVAELLVSLGSTDDELIRVLIDLMRSGEFRTPQIRAAVEYGQLDLTGFAPGDLLLKVGTKATGQLMKLLTDADPFLRTYAAWTLGRWSSLGTDVTSAVPELSARLGDATEPWYLRAYVARALGGISPTPQSVSALMEAVGAEHVVVRRESIRALGACGAAALPALPLLREVRDRDRAARNREVAIEALGRIQLGPRTRRRSGNR